MESEMEETIQAYGEVIQSQQYENAGDSSEIKKQLLEHQNLNENLQKQISKLNEELLVIKDEK